MIRLLLPLLLSSAMAAPAGPAKKPVKAAAAPAAAAKPMVFDIDPDHSAITFRIRHLVGRVSGKFTRYSGEFSGTREQAKTWKASAKIDTASIDTGVAKRDEHLRSADFFDAARCPEISFASKQALPMGKTRAKLKGDLTIHCVTKPVVLDLESDGAIVTDPWGKLRAGISASAKINRKDFDMTFNKVLDKGSTLLGDDVDIQIDIEGTARP
ncbi:MAG: YceI family protein [Elusimicrobiota bacterium]|jgi:polyisoprenoid-binding protein YceI